MTQLGKEVEYILIIEDENGSISEIVFRATNDSHARQQLKEYRKILQPTPYKIIKCYKKEVNITPFE